MSATHVILGAMLALVGVAALAPVAEAHIDLNVTVCEPGGPCFCRHVATVDTELVHLHTLCLA